MNFLAWIFGVKKSKVTEETISSERIEKEALSGLRDGLTEAIDNLDQFKNWYLMGGKKFVREIINLILKYFRLAIEPSGFISEMVTKDFYRSPELIPAARAWMKFVKKVTKSFKYFGLEPNVIELDEVMAAANDYETTVDIYKEDEDGNFVLMSDDEIETKKKERDDMRQAQVKKDAERKKRRLASERFWQLVDDGKSYADARKELELA